MSVERPENVRVQLRDGSVQPCELVYQGIKDGAHCWAALSAAPLGEVVALYADTIPGKTSIVIARLGG